MRRRSLPFCGILVAAGLLTGWAASGAVTNFYQGRQIAMVVASGAGGGYDAYARALARHITKHIPGNPAIVPKNVPGAGGLIAANALYNSTLPDGLTVAALTNGAAMDPLFGETAARFDPRKFNWIGSIGKLENICVTRPGAITRIEQAREKEVTVAASGATGNSAIMPKIVNRFLHTKFKVIGGYTEGSGVTLALERGEVDGVCGMSYSTLQATHPDWFRDHRVNVILQIGLHRLKELPQVPSAIDFVSGRDRDVLEMILIRQEMGRPFAMPPGVPAERVAEFRRAFDTTIRDPAFLAEAQKLSLEIDPLSGAEISTLLDRAYGAPKAVIAEAAELAK